MKATFFIIPESFKYNGDCQGVIENKIKNFAIDLRRIKATPVNDIFCHFDVYNVNILENHTISDVINNPNTELIDRDIIQQLRIIWELKETTDSIDDIKEVYLPNHNENECYGLMAFNSIDSVLPEYQLIYGMDSWFKFRRYFLGIYPKNEIFYIDECKKYFPNLYFHERNKTSISSIFSDCPKKIIYHLAALNDELNLIDISKKNRTQVLEAFSIIAKLDETASLEGNAAKKNDFTFTFINDEDNEVKVCCEPHLKLCFSDNSNTYSTERRIYFHEGIEKIQKGKILIGHIGKHL